MLFNFPMPSIISEFNLKLFVCLLSTNQSYLDLASLKINVL